MSSLQPQLQLPVQVVAAMQERLPQVAEEVVATVIREVPSYSEPFQGRMGRNIENAVALALAGFLDMVSGPTTDTGDLPLTDAGNGVMISTQEVFDAAYSLGQGEARSDRTMDALAAAYRVGARKAWHELSHTAVANGLEASQLAAFAELVFDYIDQLSATSVAGHADELASRGRARERQLERLTEALLRGADAEELQVLSERADWAPPAKLTALIVPDLMLRSLRAALPGPLLAASAEAVGLRSTAAELEVADLSVLLVPDMTVQQRAQVVELMGERPATMGPSRPWQQAQASYRRAARAFELGAYGSTDEHLVSLVLTADAGALADLRARVLAPIASLRPSSVAKLVETLRAWLLYQGRRQDISAALYIHPQTVRYRLSRLREFYGEKLTDPTFILEATLALGLVPDAGETV